MSIPDKTGALKVPWMPRYCLFTPKYQNVDKNHTSTCTDHFQNDDKKSRSKTPFPSLRWADKQEMWDLMCKKESGMYKRATGEELLTRHTTLQPRMRAILFDWLVEVCEVYRLHRETFYLAVDFIDRYLGATSEMPKSRLQLIGKF